MKYPGGHGALVFNDGGFEGIDGGEALLIFDVVEEGGVGEVAFAAVEGAVATASEGFDLVFDADGGGEAGEEDAAGFEEAEEVFEHGLEVGVVGGEVEDRVADDDVEGGVGEGEVFNRGQVEFFGWKIGDRLGMDVDGGDVVTFVDEVVDVATGAAAGVEDAHAGLDAASQDLVNQVNICVAQ